MVTLDSRDLTVSHSKTSKAPIYLLATAIIMGMPSIAIARDLTETERNQIIEIVKQDMRDPFTSVFEWPTANIPESGVDFIEYCGWVNGKNAYGAYAGFESFTVWMVVKDNSITTIEIPSGPGSNGVPSADKNCIEGGFGRP